MADVKVWLNLPEGWHGHGKEGLWCEEIGVDKYLLRNTPFYASGLSLNDEILANFNEQVNLIIFEKILKKSGHSTYRCMVGPERSKALQKYIDKLNEMDCWYESAIIGELELFAFDVPPHVDIELVYKVLDDGLKSGVWDFEEADYANGKKHT